MRVVNESVALVLFAVLLPLFMLPAFAACRSLNVKAICKARSADAKNVQSPPDESIADCARDEKLQNSNSVPLGINSVSIRNRCESDARSLGTTSYLDLLACIQVAEDMKSAPKRRPGSSDGQR